MGVASVAGSNIILASMNWIAITISVTPASFLVIKRVSTTLIAGKIITCYLLIHTTGEPVCPASLNYIKLNGVNVRLVSSAKSYTAATDDCQANGGFLAKISTAEELSAMQILNGMLFKFLLPSLKVCFRVEFCNLQGTVVLMTTGLASPTQMESHVLMLTARINWSGQMGQTLSGMGQFTGMRKANSFKKISFVVLWENNNSSCYC